MTSRSASGEGESLKAAMIHCLLGVTTSRARIAAPNSQLPTMRIRRTTYAIGSAGDDEARLDMVHHLPSDISIINNLFIDFRPVRYWNSIRSQGRGRRTRKAPRPGRTCPRTSSAGWTTSPDSVGLAAKREGNHAATRPALRHCLARIGRGVLQGAR